MPSFNVLPCLELVKKFVVWWAGVVGGGVWWLWWLKPILVFSLAKAEQLRKTKRKMNIYQHFPYEISTSGYQETLLGRFVG